MTILMKLADRFARPRDMTATPDLPRQRRPTVGFRAKRLAGTHRDLRAADRSGRSSACSRSTGRSRPLQDGARTSCRATSSPGSTSQPDWLGWRSLGLSPDTIGADLDGARRVHEALHQLGDRLGRRLAARRRPRLARRLRPDALPLQVRLHAQQGHLVLLPVAADPAAGRARAALPRALQASWRCSTRGSA